jgi:hypothetical protein
MIAYLLVTTFLGGSGTLQGKTITPGETLIESTLTMDNSMDKMRALGWGLKIPARYRYKWDTFSLQSEKMNLASLEMPKAIQATASQDDKNLPFKAPKPQVTWRKPVGWTVVAAGAVALVVGTYLYARSWDEDVRKGDSLQTYNIVSLSLLGVGGAAVVGGTVLLLWKDYSPVVEASEKQTTLAVRGRF